MRRLSLAALAVALVGAFLVPHSALGIGHDARAAQHPARAAQPQRFIGLQTNPSDKASPIVLGFGAIHARGKDRVISNHKDRFVFPKGSVVVVHQRAGHHATHDAKTCYFTEHEFGTFKVTSGTGAYAGATGSGKYRAQFVAVGCHQNKPPSLFMLTIKAAGSITL